jgi:hypothetical protein
MPVAKDHPTLGQYSDKDLKGHSLPSGAIHLMLFSACKVDHDQIPDPVLKVHDQVLVVQILTEMMAVMAIYISVRMLVNVFIPEQLTGNRNNGD